MRTVALVGREQPGGENLSLRYLAAALLAAGQRAEILPVVGPGCLPSVRQQILDLDPDIVGLSMVDASSTIDALALARLLRAGGYRGHITCGGPVATLVRAHLLDVHPALDSVIRHDGEVPLVELLERLAVGAPWRDVPGITTRDGDGPPAPVDSPLPLRTRPLHRDPLPRVAGVPIARLSGSRGCPARCAYCSPAALQVEALAEGRRAGLGAAALRVAGVGGTRFRGAWDLAEEVAELYFQQGARVFHFVDENLLAGGRARAEGWLDDFAAGLAARKVKEVAFCLQADPQTLTPRVLDRLEALGVVRLSVGIEGLTAAQARALGRRAAPDANLALLAELTRAPSRYPRVPPPRSCAHLCPPRRCPPTGRARVDS